MDSPSINNPFLLFWIFATIEDRDQVELFVFWKPDAMDSPCDIPWPRRTRVPQDVAAKKKLVVVLFSGGGEGLRVDSKVSTHAYAAWYPMYARMNE